MTEVIALVIKIEVLNRLLAKTEVDKQALQAELAGAKEELDRVRTKEYNRRQL